MNSNHYSTERFRRSLRHFAMGKIVGALIGLTWMLALVRALSPRDYGVYITLVALQELYLLGSNFGLTVVVDRYFPELRAAHRTLSLVTLAIRATLARTGVLLIGFTLIELIPDHLSEWAGVPGFGTILSIFAVTVTIEGVARYIEGIFESLLAQKLTQISMVTRNLLRLTCLLFLMQEPGRISLTTWVQWEAGSYLIGVTITLWLFVRHLRTTKQEQTSEIPSTPEYRRYLTYVLPVFLAQLIWLLSSIDVAKILTTRMFGTEAIALFGFCAALATMLQRYLPTYLLIGMIRPLFVTAAQAADREARIRHLCHILIKLNAFVVIPAACVVAVSGDQLISHLSGGSFQEGGALLSVMLLFVLSQAIRGSYNFVLMAVEDGQGSLIAVTCSAVVFGLSALVAASTLPVALVIGLIGADLTAIAIIRYRIDIRGIPLGFPVGGVFRIVVSAVLAVNMIQLLVGNQSTWGMYSILAWLAASAGAFLALAWILKPFDATERCSINALLPFSVFIW